MAENGSKGNKTEEHRILEFSTRIHTSEMVEEVEEVEEVVMAFPLRRRSEGEGVCGVSFRTLQAKAGICSSKQASLTGTE